MLDDVLDEELESLELLDDEFDDELELLELLDDDHLFNLASNSASLVSIVSRLSLSPSPQ